MKDKVIVLLPIIQNNRYHKLVTPSNMMKEICSLVRSINLKILYSEFFKLANPSSKYLLRKGKLLEIKDILEKHNNTQIRLVVFGTDLTAVQQRNLEKELSTKVLDKTGLILEIFGERAKSREGIIQVELAHLNWQKSRLVRSWTHLERQRGALGFVGGPGEAQIELDRRLISSRIKHLNKKLSIIIKTRNIQFKNRAKNNKPIISLLGYTNSGKSTLFKRLTRTNVETKNKLFVTLDTKISTFYLPSIKNVYISDTVGFISDLPIHLIEAFKSTLEEVKNANLLIHVRDSYSTDTENQKVNVIEVLQQLNIFPNSKDGPPMLEVMNKCDKIKEINLKKLIKNDNNNKIFISAKTGFGIEKLKKLIKKIFYFSLEILLYMHNIKIIVTLYKRVLIYQ